MGRDRTSAMLQQPTQLRLGAACAEAQRGSMQMKNQKVLTFLEKCGVEGQIGVWLLMVLAGAV